ncbi:EF-hand domain-containing protein [Methylobacillus rhizosphaerae]|nr:EF-hand domain-containing protein [Methylobacillus rhizosphaerae]
MVTKSFVFPHQLLLTALLLGCVNVAYAAGVRNASDEVVEDDMQELPTSHILQRLDAKISNEDRQRLRRDLDEYARSGAAAHAQIEERRQLMRQRLLARFQEADKDGNGVISREEATEMLPQVARHFMQFDLNDDGMITMSELETMQMRIAERQHKNLDKKEKELQEVAEPTPARVKDMSALATKRAL